MESSASLDSTNDLVMVERKGKHHFLFSSPDFAADLKKSNVYPIGLGIDPTDKKNMTAKRSPFILGELATIYLAAK